MSLPNFLIIGAPRSGTTTLYRWLGGHPDVFMPRIKEPNFFAYAGQEDRWLADRSLPLPPHSRRWGDYLRLFEDHRATPHLGEASTTYLSSSRAPAAIERLLPHVRLVAILRHPIDRAYSHYLLGVRDGWEDDSFATAIVREERERSRNPEPPTPPHHWYLRLGEYAEDVARYQARFSRDRLRFYLYSDLEDDPRGLLDDVYEFLGLRRTAYRPDLQRRHHAYGQPLVPGLQRRLRLWLSPYQHPLRRLARAACPRSVRKFVNELIHLNIPASPPPIPRRMRRELTGYYREDIQQLSELLDRDLSAWLDSSIAE